ncbi:MAG: DNA gyrase subunit A [Firmicutes bacterium ADurb.Bin193]|nr:MAG: DNA gyrase subunit A [Firmicutes bacterium ADurb.Bin193]
MTYTEQPITKTLEQNYMPYAMSVIISRAIPEIDGLKPSHRKLLYTMYKMGLLSGNRTKSANVVGQTMKLNPHGDQAIYETLVRLTRGNEALLHPLVDSKGNFGKQYSRDMAYAASRYTEVKLDPICEEIFGDIDKNTVDFIDNYDGTMKEPVLLPVRFPNILVNPNQGIAVGVASNLCSFNLKEVCDTTIAYLKNPNTDIAKTLLAPDFSTGGELIYDENEIREIYQTGRGSIKVRAKYTYDKKNNCIDITEIPYTTTVEAIIDKIIELIKQGKVREISDIRDETDLNGLKITIDLKRGTDAEKLMARLYKITPLMDTYGCNFNILSGNTPKVLGISGILDEWVRFRTNCIKRQLEYDINKKSEKLHLLMGLEKLLLDIDKAIKIIRETELEAQVVQNLMQGFDIDEVQAEYIAEIKLRNINKEYILKRTQDIEDLIDEIARLRATLGDGNKIKELIASQLKEISKKYGVPRRTAIVSPDEIVQYEQEQYIEDYNLKIFLTKDGYLKKISHVSLRAASEHKLKEGDEIVSEFDTTNKSEILVFTDKCTVYKAKTYEINDCKASLLGEYLPGVLNMDEGERVVGIAVTTDYKGYILFCFENGKMSKVSIESYATKLNRKKLTNAYGGASRLVKLFHFTEDIDLAAVSSIGKVLVFNTSSISLKSTRASQGVSVMTLKKSAVLKDVKRVEDMGLSDVKYYKTKNIPAAGCFLRPEDSKTKQTSLF